MPLIGPGTISRRVWLGAAHQLGGEIARHAGPAGRFLPISGYRVVSMALKLADTRSRSLLFLGTLWGSHAGKMNIVTSSPLKMTWVLVIGSTSPGNDFGL